MCFFTWINSIIKCSVSINRQIFIAFETEMPPELEQKNSKPERDWVHFVPSIHTVSFPSFCKHSFGAFTCHNNSTNHSKVIWAISSGIVYMYYDTKLDFIFSWPCKILPTNLALKTVAARTQNFEWIVMLQHTQHFT